MENNYQYIDPDYIYTDPKTGILRNLGNITDRRALAFVETTLTSSRTEEFKIRPTPLTSEKAAGSN
jgi:cell filamentation protein